MKVPSGGVRGLDSRAQARALRGGGRERVEGARHRLRAKLDEAAPCHYNDPSIFYVI
jgi:hypothetical protein